MGSTDLAKAHNSWQSGVGLCDCGKQVGGGVILLAKKFPRHTLYFILKMSL